MKITNIVWRKESFPLEKPFKIAIGELTSMDTILLKIETDAGLYGYGEATPIPFVTGDNIESCMAVLDVFKKILIGEDASCIGRIHDLMSTAFVGNGAAKAAIDIALHDIAAKKAGLPLYKYLGGYGNTVENDLTVGMDTAENMAKKALGFKNDGVTLIKVKLGESMAVDTERIKQIRDAVGDEITIRIDANQGWSVSEAIEMSYILKEYNVEFMEQPCKRWDFEGLAMIRKGAKIPVVADESCQGPIDALKLVKLQAVDAINIKLMKSDGIYGAEKINAIAEANGIYCMVGCMGETRVGIAAGLHFVAANKNVLTADLDSFHDMESPAIRGGFTFEGSCYTLSDEPGLGIEVDGF